MLVLTKGMHGGLVSRDENVKNVQLADKKSP